MIYGQGIDLVKIDRIKKTIDKFGIRFVERIFSKNEIRLDNLLNNINSLNSIRLYASRFAIKEAASKAIGTGISGGIEFKQIEVIKLKSGKPTIKYLDHAKKIFLNLEKAKKKLNVHVSLSNEKDYAIAIVTISN
tara:strand:+ start:576 stop:980 length:405 start_codon:yes stop_codon:yes gene_type:complete